MTSVVERPFWYRLEGHTPVPGSSDGAGLELALRDTDGRRVAKDVIGESDKAVVVSTVFLCVDHNHGFETEPALFETMVFRGDDAGGIFQMRYATWDEAMAGHQVALAWAHAGCPGESPAEETE